MKRGLKKRFLRCAACAAMLTNFGLFLVSGTGFAEEGTKAGTQIQVQADETAVQTEPAAGDAAEISPELLDEAPADQLCIGVLPTGTGGIMKYYVPDAQTRNELYDRISGMDVEKLDSLEIPPQWVLDAGELNITMFQ